MIVYRGIDQEYDPNYDNYEDDVIYTTPTKENAQSCAYPEGYILTYDIDPNDPNVEKGLDRYMMDSLDEEADGFNEEENEEYYTEYRLQPGSYEPIKIEKFSRDDFLKESKLFESIYKKCN